MPLKMVRASEEELLWLGSLALFASSTTQSHMSLQMKPSSLQYFALVPSSSSDIGAGVPTIRAHPFTHCPASSWSGSI